MDFIVSRCVGKRVLHVGCVDSGLLRRRRRTGEHLHQRLSTCAAELWGIDIDGDGIREMTEAGCPNLLTLDVCSTGALEVLRSTTFDVVVVSEVVEHVLNPGLLLGNVQAVMRPENTDLLLTVPNAFGVSTLLGLLGNVERVHLDHNYWFSYQTARTLLEKCGFRVTESLAYTFEPTRGPGVQPKVVGAAEQGALLDRIRRSLAARARESVVRFLFGRSSAWADGLVFVCRLASAQTVDPTW